MGKREMIYLAIIYIVFSIVSGLIYRKLDK